MTPQDKADQRARDTEAGWCDHGPFDACRCLYLKENSPKS